MEDEMNAIRDRKTGSEKVRSPARCGERPRGFTLLELLAVMSILSIIGVSLFTIFRQGTEVWRRSSARTEAYLKGRQILEMMAREIKGAVVITEARGPDAYFQSQSFRDVPPRADFRGFNGDNDDSDATLPGWRDTTSGTTREQPYSDQIYFVAPVTNSGEQDLCMIGYFIKDMRKEDTKSPIPPSYVPRDSTDDRFWRLYLTDKAKADPDDEWRAFDFSSSSLNSYISQTGEVATSVLQLEIKYYDYEEEGGRQVLKEYDAWDSRPYDLAWDADQRGTTRGQSRRIPDYEDDDRLPVAVKITVTVGDDNGFIKGLRLSTIVYLENAGRRQAL
jgi:prepilin-type N-terminal cleavage/methylation domain-containing protein